MASNRPTPAVSADLPEAGATDLPLDHALSLLLADETENALRWGAAVLESGPWTPSALVVTARLLDQMGRRRAAIEGLKLAVQQAIAEGNLPLAMAAIGDLRTFGAEVTESLDRTDRRGLLRRVRAAPRHADGAPAASVRRVPAAQPLLDGARAGLEGGADRRDGPADRPQRPGRRRPASRPCRSSARWAKRRSTTSWPHSTR